MKTYIDKAKAKRTKVVAKLTTADGLEFVAVNVESSCHSLSICAERAVVFKAVSEVGPSLVIGSIEVYAERDGEPLDIIPCGGCRQVISEYADSSTLLLGKPVEYWIPHPYK